MNAQLTREQLEAMVLTLQATVEAQKADMARKITLKVGEKGTVCLYHGGRYPVTLYRAQWERVLPFLKSGAIERFIEANASLLAAPKA